MHQITHFTVTVLCRSNSAAFVIPGRCFWRPRITYTPPKDPSCQPDKTWIRSLVSYPLHAKYQKKYNTDSISRWIPWHLHRLLPKDLQPIRRVFSHCQYQLTYSIEIERGTVYTSFEAIREGRGYRPEGLLVGASFENISNMLHRPFG
jgi:hypothetical protein